MNYNFVEKRVALTFSSYNDLRIGLTKQTFCSKRDWAKVFDETLKGQCHENFVLTETVGF